MGDRKEYYKNYYLLNKEIMKLQIRENYNCNKERINEKVKCECGRVLIKRMMKKHLKTHIHNKLLLINNENNIENIEIENNVNDENKKKTSNGIAIFR